VLPTSCAGIVGREGPGETMREVGMLTVAGEGFTLAHVDGLYGPTSFVRGVELGRQLAAAPQPVRMVYLLASGIDIANDRLLAGLESVLGPDVVIFGATSSDHMQGVASFQAVDGVRYQHGAFAVGFWDPTLDVETQATHGFLATGEPMVVTAAEGNRILELDGAPAWPTFLRRLGLPAGSTLADTIPIGALAEALPRRWPRSTATTTSSAPSLTTANAASSCTRPSAPWARSCGSRCATKSASSATWTGCSRPWGPAGRAVSRWPSSRPIASPAAAASSSA